MVILIIFIISLGPFLYNLLCIHLEVVKVPSLYSMWRLQGTFAKFSFGSATVNPVLMPIVSK